VAQWPVTLSNLQPCAYLLLSPADTQGLTPFWPLAWMQGAVACVCLDVDNAWKACRVLQHSKTLLSLNTMPGSISHPGHVVIRPVSTVTEGYPGR
jgi:hypothetical protein